jgi:hypothetical protein
VTRKNIENSQYSDKAAAELVQSYPALPPDIAYNRICLWGTEHLRSDLEMMHRYKLNMFRESP